MKLQRASERASGERKEAVVLDRWRLKRSGLWAIYCGAVGEPRAVGHVVVFRPGEVAPEVKAVGWLSWDGGVSEWLWAADETAGGVGCAPGDAGAK